MAVETQIQLRRDTTANWAATNPILGSGELGLESTTNKVKVGDGSTDWNTLPYLIAPPHVYEIHQGSNQVIADADGEVTVLNHTEKFAVTGFTASGGEVTVDIPGLYLISYSVTVQQRDNSSANEMRTRLQIDGNDVPAGRCGGSTTDVDNGRTTLALSTFVEVTAGSVIRTRVNIIKGTADIRIQPDTANMTFLWIREL